jgi:2Fe-2S ferredoxin
MQAAVTNGVDGIVGECGGSAMCATCHVYVDEAFLDRLEPMSELEDELLESTASPRLPNSRLGCQISLTNALDGLVVKVPDRQT